MPNHERPFHVEAAALSSIQVLFGFVTLATFSENLFSYSEHPLWIFDLRFCVPLPLKGYLLGFIPEKSIQSFETSS